MITPFVAETAATSDTDIRELKRLMKKQQAAAEKQIARLDKHLAKTTERMQTMETQLSVLLQAAHDATDVLKEYQDATAQERYWAGHNGVRYVMHHLSKAWETRLPTWTEILGMTDGVGSVVELGCNIGDNLRAIGAAAPETSLAGVEINRFAAEKAQTALPNASINVGSLLHFETDERYDLAFTRGVLIHINPEELPRAYSQLARLSKRYVLIYEHYSEQPHTLNEYAKAGTIVGTEEGESYQFWRDFATDFQTAEPGWTIVGEGPAGVEKTHGALVWTLFERA